MIAVFDNFLNEELLNEIKNDPTFFADPGRYYYWDHGWWGGKTDTLKKRLIEAIWYENCPISKSFEIHGFEYWTGIQQAPLDSEDSDVAPNHSDVLPQHYDKDEAIFAQTGEIVTPVIGTVYYPGIEDFEGGDLAIYTDGPDATPEIIKAKPNRLIIFGAGDYIHAVQPITKGTRHAIAINLWAKEPYTTAPVGSGLELTRE